MDHGLGRKPQPLDLRDFHVSRIPFYGPARGATRQFWTMGGGAMRLDQGQTGTCEGNAWTNWLIAGPVVHPDVAAFADAGVAETWARKLYVDATGDTSLQQGAYTRQILKVLKTRGEIGTYAAMSTADEIVNALLTVGPVCHGSDWYESMFDPISKYGNSYLVVDESSGVAGGHAYCLTAVDLAPADGPAYVRVENSWGSGWGHNGTARLSITNLHRLFVGDAWTATEQPF
jgi:hypothetical protein